jgi:hypothetical protein
MVLSMSLLALVLGAATAVVALAARSAPDPKDPLAEQITLQSIADQIALDAGDASEVELIGKHELHLVCDDITGDGVADTIVYSWSGDAGEPLTRALNGVERVMIPAMEGLAFAASGVLLGVDGESVPTTKTNQLVASVAQVGAAGPAYSVRSNPVAQRFKARVPSSATEWSLTGVSLWLGRDGLSESQGVVQICADDNGAPGSVLAQRTFIEAHLSGSPRSESFAFSLTGLDPDAAYWIVVRTSLLLSPCDVMEASGSIASDAEALARWISSDSKWAVSPDKSLVFAVHGDVAMTTPRMTVESRATALFVDFSTERARASSGARLAHRPLLIVDADADVEIVASQALLDAVGETLDDVIDVTGGLLGGLLSGGGT